MINLTRCFLNDKLKQETNWGITVSWWITGILTWCEAKINIILEKTYWFLKTAHHAMFLNRNVLLPALGRERPALTVHPWGLLRFAFIITPAQLQ